MIARNLRSFARQLAKTPREWAILPTNLAKVAGE